MTFEEAVKKLNESSPLDTKPAKGMEVIYCQHDDDFLPEDFYPDNNWGYNEAGTVNGKRWEIGMPKLTPEEPFAFRADRIIFGVPSDKDQVECDYDKPRCVAWRRDHHGRSFSG